MTIYLCSFFLSCIFLAVAERKKTGRYGRILCTAVGLLIPILLAGLRADSVGTDVATYIIPLVNAAKKSVPISSLRSVFPDMEIVFLLIVVFLTKVFGSPQVVLTVIHTIIVVFVYLGLSNYRKRFPLWLGMLVFYLMYYNMSLNLMRQWIAMVILLFGSKYMFSKRLVPYITCVLIAMLFHITAITGLVLYWIYWYLNTSNRTVLQVGEYRISGQQLRVAIVLLLLTLFIYVIANVAARILNWIGLGKYTYYLQGSFVFSLNQIILRIPLLLVTFINRKHFFRSPRGIFLFCMVCADLLLSQLSTKGNGAWRMTLYFGMYSVLTYPMTCYAQQASLRRFVSTAITLVFVLAYWGYTYVLTGAHETLPYLFFF